MKQRAKRLEMRKERTESEGQLQESVIHALSIVQRNMNSRNECTLSPNCLLPMAKRKPAEQPGQKDRGTKLRVLTGFSLETM